MDLPEEKAAIFSDFVDWLYRSDGLVGKCTTAEQFVGLFKLYFFAERLCINDLQNRLIDRVRLTTADLLHEIECGPWISIPFAAFIFKNTTKASPMREYCIQELAYRLWKGDGSTLPTSEDMKEICAHWSSQGELIEDFFEFLRFSPCEIDPPWDNDEFELQKVSICKFHRHVKGEICYLDAKDDFSQGIWSGKLDFSD